MHIFDVTLKGNKVFIMLIKPPLQFAYSECTQTLRSVRGLMIKSTDLHFFKNSIPYMYIADAANAWTGIILPRK